MEDPIGQWKGNYSPARRRYQRGSLIRDRDRWLGRWREDVVDDTGAVKRVRRKQLIGTTADFPTQRLAMRELERRLDSINNDEYRPTRLVTFAVFAERWMKMVLVHQKGSSQSGVRSHIRAHLLPVFGSMRLADIRLELIQQFVTRSKKSPTTVRNLIVTLMSMWNTALAWGCVQHNPFSRGASGRLVLKLPAASPSQTYHYTVTEAMAIIDKAKGRWKVFFRILAETGMRPGELIGLRRDAIGDQSITIAQSVWRQQVQTPKSNAGMRTFAISTLLADEIRNLLDTTPDNDYGLVFVTGPGKRTPGGKPLSMDNVRQRVLNPILDELGIRPNKRCGLYAFRHMNATLMDSLNTPMKTRQQRLGHAQIETTLKHYTHAVDADDKAVADALGAMLSPKETQPSEPTEEVPTDIFGHSTLNAEMISIRNTAHIAQLLQFSKVTRYPTSEVLNRAIDLFMIQEAPVYLGEAKQR